MSAELITPINGTATMSSLTIAGITVEDLRSILSYDPATGIFRWRAANDSRWSNARARNSFNGKYAGRIAGAKTQKGYLAIKIGVRSYAAHRLAWFFVTGEWPSDQVDHKNGSRFDNSFSNLRLASAKENARNRSAGPTNLSKRTGVTWHKGASMWQVRIMADGKSTNLGYFANIQDAITKREQAEILIHGEFSYGARQFSKQETAQ